MLLYLNLCQHLQDTYIISHTSERLVHACVYIWTEGNVKQRDSFHIFGRVAPILVNVLVIAAPKSDLSSNNRDHLDALEKGYLDVSEDRIYRGFARWYVSRSSVRVLEHCVSPKNASGGVSNMKFFLAVSKLVLLIFKLIFITFY